jgi:hypothetical protein
MRARPPQTGSARRIGVRRRLERGCPGYLLFLMVVTTQPALAEAARFSGRPTAHFSQRLQAHRKVAVSTLASLSKPPAQPVAPTLPKFQGLPWPRALIVDSTRPHRARLQPANAQRFQPGNGFVIGHPWTTIVVILHARRLPLRPIPFYRQRSGREQALA